MRILFVIHELALNGAVLALMQQVRRLCARGDAVTILTPALTGAAAALEAEFRQTGATVTSKLASANEYDVAVGCTALTHEAMSQLVDALPTVWWIHEGRAGVNMILPRPKAMAALGRVTRLIFPSRGVVERLWSPLLGNLPPGRVEIIPAGIAPPALGTAMAKPAGQVRIVCVGSICPRKRQVDVVKAVSAIGGLPLQCVLIGEPFALEAPGEDLIRANPQRFLLTGGLSPEDVQSWYRSSDVFCLPSSDECMPIAPVEAAWHGIPVILSDLECYEGVWRHGINALIHPVGDFELLAWYIRVLMESPTLRARLTAEARNVARRFSEERANALFDITLREAIGSFRGKS